jgi:hypothetical protein
VTVRATLAFWMGLLALLAACGKGAPGSGSGTDLSAQNVLLEVFPDPDPADAGTEKPMTDFTFEKITGPDRVPGVAYEVFDVPIRFLPSDGVSTASNEVSVDVLDAYEWRAAARSSQDGVCYTVRSTADRTDPKFGATYFGQLPEGTPCSAKHITPENTGLKSWPTK